MRWAWTLAALSIPLGAWALDAKSFEPNDVLRAADVQALWDAVRALEGADLDARITALEGGDLDARITALEEAVAVPPGTVVAFAGDAADLPEGWLLCDGAEVSRTGDNAALFAAMGINHGGGDGVDTFNLPDYRGYFLRGLDDPTGDMTGPARDPDYSSRSVGSQQADAFASHDHGGGRHRHSAGDNAGSRNTGVGNGIIVEGVAQFFQGYTDYNEQTVVEFEGGPETRPKNVAVNYIIKY